MLHLKPLCFAVLLLGFGSLALGQSRPETADLEASFQELVPAGWEFVNLVVEAQENYGTEVEPDIRTRFQATVVLEQDTFEAAGELMSAILLRPVLLAGEQRTYFGLAQSVRRLGEWETSFNLENNPTLGTGSVLDSFHGVRLVLGSDAEADYRAGLEAEAEAATAAEVARLAREERIREQERASELAEIAHLQAVQEAEAQAAREAEVARVAQEQALATALREHEAADRAVREAEMEELQEELIGRLAAELRVQLASHWEFGGVEPVGITRRGTFDEPVFVLAFTTALELQEDTFTAHEVEGGGLILDSLQTEGAVQVLEGAAVGTWNAGNWDLDVRFDNLDGFSAGLPRGYYPATAVVAGTGEEAAYWQAVEKAAEEELERELAAIARQEQLASAKHEAARTAAAQAAQLAAIEIAARAAEFAAVEASIIETADSNQQLAAFEQAFGSEDEFLRELAIEAALTSNHEIVLNRVVPEALASGNGRLIDLAIGRSLFSGGGLRFTFAGSANYTILISELGMNENGTVSASVTGSHRDFDCGVVSGTLRSGQLALVGEKCDLHVMLSGSTLLDAQYILDGRAAYRFTSPYPGIGASE